MKECITHHHACDCLEEATRKLVIDLLGTDKNWKILHAEAVRLGYVQGQADRPAQKGVGK
jgi:hypothetical protein